MRLLLFTPQIHRCNRRSCCRILDAIPVVDLAATKIVLLAFMMEVPKPTALAHGADS